MIPPGFMLEALTLLGLVPRIFSRTDLQLMIYPCRSAREARGREHGEHVCHDPREPDSEFRIRTFSRSDHHGSMYKS